MSTKSETMTSPDLPSLCDSYFSSVVPPELPSMKGLLESLRIIDLRKAGKDTLEAEFNKKVSALTVHAIVKRAKCRMRERKKRLEAR
jgi:hypothetical protein